MIFEGENVQYVWLITNQTLQMLQIKTNLFPRRRSEKNLEMYSVSIACFRMKLFH